VSDDSDWYEIQIFCERHKKPHWVYRLVRSSGSWRAQPDRRPKSDKWNATLRNAAPDELREIRETGVFSTELQARTAEAHRKHREKYGPPPAEPVTFSGEVWLDSADSVVQHIGLGVPVEPQLKRLSHSLRCDRCGDSADRRNERLAPILDALAAQGLKQVSLGGLRSAYALYDAQHPERAT
jgi:hypothetical protein